MAQLPKIRKCNACLMFFAMFRCGANQGEGECDCPKCQGYCKCHETSDKENA